MTYSGNPVLTSLILADVRLTDPPKEDLVVNTAPGEFVFVAPFGDGWIRVILLLVMASRPVRVHARRAQRRQEVLAAAVLRILWAICGGPRAGAAGGSAGAAVPPCWSASRRPAVGAAPRLLEPGEDRLEAGGESFVAVVGPDVLADGRQRREAVGRQ